MVLAGELQSLKPGTGSLPCAVSDLLPLPIPVRSASVAVVLHIEDWNMGAVEHAFAPVIHITQFDAEPLVPEDAAGRTARKRQSTWPP